MTDENHYCWDELDDNQFCCGYCGEWKASADGQEWVETCEELDIIRVTPGCSFEVRTESDEVYTYDADVRVCDNEVGCDQVRYIRVFKTPGTVLMNNQIIFFMRTGVRKSHF